MEILTMTNQEVDRLRMIRSVIEGKSTWKEAACRLILSERQIGNLVARVRRQGNRGIIHGLRGQPSNHQLESGLLERALGILRQPRYEGFGPTFANEKLQKIHTIKLSVPTLRLGMVEAGLWKSKKEKVKHRAWRERRACLGELIQLDGSDHDWFEGRGPRCVLLIYIDDATSRILYGEFIPVEDTLNLFKTTRTYLKRHGRPIAFYVDKDSIYKVNRQASIEEELRDDQPLTQFTRAMEDLGVKIIAANSPQAKGRVERGFKTHQDRLVKELRLAGISNMKAANEFLWNVYIPEHNARFAVQAAGAANAHRPLLKTHRLEEILCWRTQRTLLNDFTLRFRNQFFQILESAVPRVRPGVKIFIEIRLDQSMHVRYQDHCLPFKRIVKRSARSRQDLEKSLRGLFEPKSTAHAPPPNHPWRASYKTIGRKQTLAEQGLFKRKPEPLLNRKIEMALNI